ncbi:MAG: hypothetical protein AAF392_03560 [Bacteroidota bacterium]
MATTLDGTQLLVGVENSSGNPYDSSTLLVTLSAIRRMFEKDFTQVIVARISWYRV